ncbi:hypothetical protein DPV78_001218 [Talaromyces pinophilus]|jgi:hypothetical protein|nr:hypothetical protein DPV78_001218 [Talaromyces pinophilus]
MELIIILVTWCLEQNSLVKYERITNHSQEPSGVEEISYLGNFVPQLDASNAYQPPVTQRMEDFGTFFKTAEIPQVYQPCDFMHGFVQAHGDSALMVFWNKQERSSGMPSSSTYLASRLSQWNFLYQV